MRSVTWRSAEVLAWTDRDGPGRPPRGPSRILTGAVAGMLVAAQVGMLLADTLCPEHRAWVLGLGSAGMLAAGGAVVGLLRGWASSARWTVAASGFGIALGAIDAAHEPARGRLIVAVFAALALLGVLLELWHVRLRRWERRTLAALRPAPVADRKPPRSPVGEPVSIAEHGAPYENATASWDAERST